MGSPNSCLNLNPQGIRRRGPGEVPRSCRWGPRDWHSCSYSGDPREPLSPFCYVRTQPEVYDLAQGPCPARLQTSSPQNREEETSAVHEPPRLCYHPPGGLAACPCPQHSLPLTLGCLICLRCLWLISSGPRFLLSEWSVGSEREERGVHSGACEPGVKPSLCHL